MAGLFAIYGKGVKKLAGIKISALPPAGSSLLTDIFPAVQAGVTNRETLQQVLTLFDANIQLASPSQVTGLGQAALKDVTDNAEPLVVSISGATAIDNLASFIDIVGTVEDSGIAKTDVALLSGATFTGTVVLNGTQMSGNDAATVAFVLANASGLIIQVPCYAGTTANLNATQAGAGVGATLTNAGAMAAFATDGVTPPLNSRILVKDQTLDEHNGIYTLTDAGSGATNWELTRATDYDQAAEIQPGDLVVVLNGTTLASTSWLQYATVTTVDTDPVLFVQFTVTPASLGTAAFKNTSDNAEPTVAAVSGATTLNNLLSAADTGGTVQDSGFASSVLTVSANSLLGNNTGAPATQSSLSAAQSRTLLGVTTVGTATVGQIPGTTTNDDATAGNVGEFISANVLAGSAVPLTSGLISNITSISLTAGDWLVSGTVFATPGSGTIISEYNVGISQTSVTFETPGPTSSRAQIVGNAFSANTQIGLSTGPCRISLAGTTTIYLVARCNFSVSTLAGFGFLTAWRMR